MLSELIYTICKHFNGNLTKVMTDIYYKTKFYRFKFSCFVKYNYDVSLMFFFVLLF